MVIIGETFKLEIRTLADLPEEIFSLRDEPDVICIIRQNFFRCHYQWGSFNLIPT
jgi:hypothetical protein